MMSPQSPEEPSMGSHTLIAAFGEDHASRLSGVSRRQLRLWDKKGFYVPAFAAEDRAQDHSRIYSFKDVVSLRVLNSLRNQYGVAFAHLVEVKDKLAHLEEDCWTGHRLYVVKKKVVWVDPEMNLPIEIVGQQFIESIVLTELAAETASRVATLRSRSVDSAGKVQKLKNVMGGAPTFAGTRITLRSVLEFVEDGYTNAQILAEYPDLTESDVEFARSQPPSSKRKAA